ncbi:hypothetical protein [Okeania sp. SIO3I5]|nr:hypothetical protein [Okeania sp. SIO3I5]
MGSVGSVGSVGRRGKAGHFYSNFFAIAKPLKRRDFYRKIKV